MLVKLLLMPPIASAIMMLVRSRVWLEIIHALAALSGLAGAALRHSQKYRTRLSARQ